MIERHEGDAQEPIPKPDLRVVEQLPPPRWMRTQWRALKLFLFAAVGVPAALTLGVLGAVVLNAVGAHGWPTQMGGLGVVLVVGVCTLMAGLGVIYSVISLVQMALTRDRVSVSAAVVIGLLQVVGGTLATLFGAALTLLASGGFARGRQLRRFGKLQLPPVQDGDAWASLPLNVDPDPDLRNALAAQWRENGRTEHASIAAFAKLTLDLVALGAPPKLIADAQRDALDELRHTELCFSLARALDGKAESPGPFPAARSASGASGFIQLAVDSLVDGALHEGVSARVIAQLVKRCDEPATREVLRELAADEGRHAAHGWDVVAWCVEQGGEAVRDALLGAVQALPSSIAAHVPEGARGGGWERFGIHGEALEREEYARMVENLKRRVGALSPRARAA